MYDESIAHDTQQCDEPECDGTGNIPKIEVEYLVGVFTHEHPRLISPGKIGDIVFHVFNYITIGRHV